MPQTPANQAPASSSRSRWLCHGVSGVRIELLERLQAFIAHDILPLIPEEGSVGASGDLTPLSYVAAVLCGEREVLHDGRVQPAAEVLAKIGADATGLPFNSIMAILLEKDHPSTPLVNAGAIAACSMIKPIGKPDAKWEAIQGFIEGLCGSSVEVIDELYKSETATNFNNKSIAWLLKNYSRIYDDPDMALDLYTRQCSIGVTARQLAVAAATIAFDGVNPVTKQTVFKPDLGTRIASMMATVGFYEHTGDWLFNTGLPAKTGVGGGIMGVVPGVMGVAAFAPPLDDAGNSVKAQAALSDIVGRLNLNIFHPRKSILAEQA